MYVIKRQIGSEILELVTFELPLEPVSVQLTDDIREVAYFDNTRPALLTRASFRAHGSAIERIAHCICPKLIEHTAKLSAAAENQNLYIKQLNTPDQYLARLALHASAPESSLAVRLAFIGAQLRGDRLHY